MIAWLLLLLACPGDEPEIEPEDEALDEADGVYANPQEAQNRSDEPGVVHVALEAAPHTFQVAGETIDGYAYNGQIPGPTIRASKGDRVIVELSNALSDPTTIHWHGLEVPFAMDGVTWQTDPVEPGDTFVYDFVVEQAGTFWYHPHFDTERQVDLGLYGAFIVEDPAEPEVGRELVMLMDIWGEARDDHGEAAHKPAPPLHGGGEDGHVHLDAMGPWTVNGLLAPELALAGGERVRVRMINVANMGYLDLRWPEPRIIALDQGLLPEPWAPDGLVLAPGDRAEAEWRAGEDGFELITQPYTMHGGPAWGEPQTLVDVDIEDAAQPASWTDWGFEPAAPTPDPGWTDVLYVLSGEGDQWAINGEQFPDVTIETLPYGAEVIIEVRNLSATEHPFHLHGLVFEVLSLDGEPPPFQMFRDTLNLPIASRARLAIHADNPGDWMAHCHILPHAHGMMTVLRVLEPEG